MIGEARAAQLDLAARAAFATDGELVRETRGQFADLLNQPDGQPHTASAESTSDFAAAADGGFVEVG